MLNHLLTKPNSMDKNNSNTLNTQIQYKMIEKLSSMNQKLVNEVNERKTAQENLEHTNDELQKALKVKSDFLSTMSHEIRTPLNIIIGYSQVLEQAKLETQEIAHFNSIKLAADSLLRIIDQILEYSKLDSQDIQLEKNNFRIKDLLEKIPHYFDTEINDKRIKYKLEIDQNVPSCLYGDEKKLHTILYNLIGNAFKFTPSGEVIAQVSFVKKEWGVTFIRFCISDTGIGMSKEEISSIFERFRQVQSTISRNYGGVGLGLAISKKLTELMDGEIEVKSCKGIGSSFYFTIPLQQINYETIDSTNSSSFNTNLPLSNVKVLLAEDDPFNQTLAITILKDLGCKTQIATNGEEAYEMAKINTYDIILMDLHMPVMNGFDASKQIQMEGIKTPILGFSADVLSETQQKVMGIGMDGFITKPFTIDDLVKTIKRHLP